MYHSHWLILIFLISCFYCNPATKKEEADEGILSRLEGQLSKRAELSEQQNRIPRTVHEGEIKFTGQLFDWTEGFFPGTCWYMFELTGDEKWKQYALNFQQQFIDHRFLTTNHDLGFVFNCSFGHAYRLTNKDEYRTVLIDAANSLITRFNPNVGCIKSWDVDRGWQSERGWQYPVIIDNMMNLELLFEVSKITGDEIYKQIAVTHALTTMKNHFRDDGSSYHVIDYDTLDGTVRNRHTAQGYAHESAWARGQAWGIYGFTISFRYTKDQQYLKKAETIANFVLNHPNLPAEKVPYWDFNAPNIPDEFRDASAAAIIASALLELDKYSSSDYESVALEIIRSLSSEKYFAASGTNHNFLLMHCVGSIPHGNEIDVPLNYADYYFVEAMYRLRIED